MLTTDTAHPQKLTLAERQTLAVPARPIVAEAEFLTRTRDDLFTLTQRLMSSISPLALQDPGNPVIVTVRGAFAGGKKIFPDATRQYMLSPEPDFEGQENHYELWRDQDFEIDFFNHMHAMVLYDHRAEQSGAELPRRPSIEERPKFHHDARTEFLNLRRHGGITFIHNDEATAKYHADIDIRLEDSTIHPVTYELTPTPLTPAFKVLAAGYEWARLIKIDIKNEELMQYEPFARTIESMQLPAETISTRFYDAAKSLARNKPLTATQFLARKNIPVYGVNIARPD